MSAQRYVRLAQRSKMILLAAEAIPDLKIAAELGVTRQTVARWLSRFIVRGLEGIEKDAPRPRRKPQISAKQVQQIVRRTDATHWSTRTMAQAAGISEASVRRIWKRHGLKPHLLRTFKLSNDPLFVEKVEDIAGLYLTPPDGCRNSGENLYVSVSLTNCQGISSYPTKFIP